MATYTLFMFPALVLFVLFLLATPFLVYKITMINRVSKDWKSLFLRGQTFRVRVVAFILTTAAIATAAIMTGYRVATVPWWSSLFLLGWWSRTWSTMTTRGGGWGARPWPLWKSSGRYFQEFIHARYWIWGPLYIKKEIRHCPLGDTYHCCALMIWSTGYDLCRRGDGAQNDAARDFVLVCEKSGGDLCIV